MRRLSRTAAALLVLLPPLWIFWTAASKTVEVPKSDDWSLTAGLLAKGLDGTLRFADFHAQDNDSRMVLPRLQYYLLARLTGWSHRAETLFIVAQNLALLALCWLMLRQTPAIAPPARPWVLAGCSALIFYPLMGINWTFGVVTAYYWVTLPVAAIGAVFASPLPFAAKFAIGLLCSLAATYSFLCGWLAWGLFLLCLLAAPGGFRALAARAAVWAVLAGLTGWVYFSGYEFKGRSGLAAAVLAEPLKYLGFFLGWIGSPLGSGLGQLKEEVSITLGVLALAALAPFGTGALRLFVRDRGRLTALLQWLNPAVFAVLCGVMIALGRADLNPDAAYWGRYLAFSVWIWIALLARLAFTGGKASAPLLWAKRGALAAALALYAAGWTAGNAFIADDHARTLRLKACYLLREIAPPWDAFARDDSLPALGPKLEEAGLIRPAAFRSADVSALPSERVRDAGSHSVRGRLLSARRENGALVAEAWAVDTARQRTPDAVVFAVNGADGIERLHAIGLARGKGPAEARKLPGMRSARAGFSTRADKPGRNAALPPLPEEELEVTAFAVDADSGILYRLEGSVPLPAASQSEPKSE